MMPFCLTVGEKEGEVHWTWDKNKYQCVREKDGGKGQLGNLGWTYTHCCI